MRHRRKSNVLEMSLSTNFDQPPISMHTATNSHGKHHLRTNSCLIHHLKDNLVQGILLSCHLDNQRRQAGGGNNLRHLFPLYGIDIGINSNHDRAGICILVHPLRVIHTLVIVVWFIQQLSQKFLGYAPLTSVYHLSRLIPRERMHSRRGTLAV